jgi:hypothetical protein
MRDTTLHQVRIGCGDVARLWIGLQVMRVRVGAAWLVWQFWSKLDWACRRIGL